MPGGNLREHLTADAVVETAIAAGGLGFLNDVQDASSRLGLSAEAFAHLAVRRFFERADDEAMASLVSAINGAQAPETATVAFILRQAVRDAREVFA